MGRIRTFKQDMEGIFNNAKNAFKCNICMSYVLYKTHYADKIAQLDGLKGFENSAWNFYSYLQYEIVIYKANSTIGNAVALPEHFYKKSNEKI